MNLDAATEEALAVDGNPASVRPSAQADRGASGPAAAGRALISAVTRADIDSVKTLLESYADPNTVDDHGETPLFEAAATSNINMVATLLQWGADPQKRSRDGMVPRELTANRSIHTLFDLFEDLEVPSNNKELMLAELSPGLSKEIEELLDSNIGRGGRDAGEQGAEVAVSSFYADVGGEVGAVSSFYADEEPAPKPGTPPPPPPPPIPKAPEITKKAPEITNKSEKELLAESKQVFEVIKTKRCKVYAEADLDATVLTKKSRGAYVYGMELTMNLWLRLHDRVEGWMLMDMQNIDGQREVLHPKDGALELVVRNYQSQGICCLEVCPSEAAVHKVPSEEGKVISTRGAGEFVFARSQSFNGWVRLVGNEGWMRGYGPSGAAVLRVVDPGMDDVDQWAVSDLWAAVRKEHDGILSRDTVSALKTLEEEALQKTYGRLSRCRPGREEDYLALGLTEEDLQQSRVGISRRLFVLVLQELLESRSPPVLNHLPNLVFYKHPPQLKESIGVLEYDRKDAVKLYNLGPDCTVYDQETGKVCGLWNSDTQKILPMTHLSLFFQDHPWTPLPNVKDDKGGKEGAPFPGDGLQSDSEEDALRQKDSVDAAEEGAGTHRASAAFENDFDQGIDLLRSQCFSEAVPFLNQALIDYESDRKVDLELECRILTARAECWAGLEDFEQLLAETDRILALDNDLVGPSRHTFHTGMVADRRVQQLRHRAFNARRAERGTTREPGEPVEMQPRGRPQGSLADID